MYKAYAKKIQNIANGKACVRWSDETASLLMNLRFQPFLKVKFRSTTQIPPSSPLHSQFTSKDLFYIVVAKVLHMF